MKKNRLIFFFIIICGGISLLFIPSFIKPSPPVSSFDDCIKGKNIVLDSYPPQCKTKDGRSFTQDIGNELELNNQISISSPRPNQIITSPLKITGKARGSWFFEAIFSARLVDENNKTLASTTLQANGEWMTEEFVPFKGQMDFSTNTKSGKLILEKANPSDLPENSKELIIPVKFQ